MRIVTGLAVVMLVGGSLMAVNPLIAPEPVGSLPLLNWLPFAYALPALLLVAIAREIERSAEPGSRSGCRAWPAFSACCSSAWRSASCSMAPTSCCTTSA